MERIEYRSLHSFHAKVLENLEKKLSHAFIQEDMVTQLIATMKNELLLLSPRYYHDDQDVLSGSEPIMLRLLSDHQPQDKADDEKTAKAKHGAFKTSILDAPSPMLDIGPYKPTDGKLLRWIVITGPCFFLQENGGHELSKALYECLSRYWKHKLKNGESYIEGFSPSDMGVTVGSDAANDDDSASEKDLEELEDMFAEPLDTKTISEAQAIGWNPFAPQPVQASYDPTANALKKSRRSQFIHPFLEHGIYFGTNPMTMSMYYGGNQSFQAICVDTEVTSVTLDFSSYFTNIKG